MSARIWRGASADKGPFHTSLVTQIQSLETHVKAEGGISVHEIVG